MIYYQKHEIDLKKYKLITRLIKNQNSFNMEDQIFGRVLCIFPNLYERKLWMIL